MRVGRVRMHHHGVLHRDASRHEIRQVLWVEQPAAGPGYEFLLAPDEAHAGLIIHPGQVASGEPAVRREG